jgi:hypothetical protein
MADTIARIEIHGDGAKATCNHVLSNLSVTADSIEGVDIDVTVANGSDTTVSLTADGPLASIVAKAMMEGVEWSDHDVAAIMASVEGADGGESNDGESDDADGTADRSSSDPYRPQVTPMVDKVDPEYVEFPGEAPGRIRENTYAHAACDALARWYEANDADWATSKQLASEMDSALKVGQLSTALSSLFRRMGLLVRRQLDSAGNVAYEYHPTKQLFEEFERLGPYPSGDGSGDGSEDAD